MAYDHDDAWGDDDHFSDQYEPSSDELNEAARAFHEAEESFTRHGPEEPTSAPPPTLRRRSVSDTLAEPPEEPPDLITGLLRQGEMCVIGAPRAIGKSWLGMNAAALLGRGQGLLGGTFPIAGQAKVLYSQGELDEYGSWERWQKIGGGRDIPNVIECHDRWRVNVTRRRTTMRLDSGVTANDEYIDAILDPRLERTIAEDGTQVLILDPWIVYYGGKENSNDEVEAALSKLRDLTLRYRLAVLCFHHITGKVEPGSREPEDLWRGASRLADWASTRVTILPHFSAKKAGELHMSRREARRHVDVLILRRGAQVIDDFSMRMNWSTGWWERWVPPGEEHGGWSLADIAAKCRADDGWPTIKAASDAIGCGYSKASELLDAAVEMGYLASRTGPRGAKSFVWAAEPEVGMD